jgi:hypothetical protein
MIEVKPLQIGRLAELDGIVPARSSRTGIGNSSQQTTFLHWLLILAVALIATHVMWAPALLWGHSAWFDLTRMVEFDAAIRAGDYWPMWSPDLYHGLGSPLFQFYAPLVYFVTEIPVLAGMDIPSALKVTQVLSLIASGLAMYFFAAKHVSRWAACFGAVLYMIAPYRFVDLFMRHALAENAAFVWLPLIAWGTEQFSARNSRAGLIIGILSTAGLILTHNLMALIGLPVCVFVGWMLSRHINVRATLCAGIPAVIGVGVAALFWWPALTGRPLIQAEQSLTTGHFDYHQHFVAARNFLDPTWEFGTDEAAIGQTSTQIGLPHLLAAIGALALVFSRWRTRWNIAAVVVTVGAVAMCHSVLRPIWELVPFAKYLQFPWRFLSLVVFGSALCGATLLHRLKLTWPRLEMPVFFGAVLAVMTAYLPCYTTARFLAANSLTNSFARVEPQQVEATQARGALVRIDRVVTPSTIRSVGERASSGDDFLPTQVRQKPVAPAPQPLVVRGGDLKEYDRPALNAYHAKVSMRETGKIELNQFWFPGWSASLDDRPIEIAPSGQMAIVSCDVPAGDHVIDFKYSGLPQRRTGVTISSLSIIAAAALIFFGRSRRQFGDEVAL